MSIEAIKEKARNHELKEQWQKALDLYLKAIQELDQEEELDISLYNRVGDLEVRMDKVDAAVEHYEKAVDLYMESELPNNAIAVCKKVIRNLPERHSIYLKMGQIRASQGFLTDARQNFLTYAEAMQAAGDMEAAFQALVEFVELAPDDIEIRLALAEQLAQHDRTDEAVGQFKEARRRLILNDRDDEARSVADKLGEIAPAESLMGADEIRAAGPEEVTTSPKDVDDWASSFAFGDEEEEEEAAEVEEEEEIEAEFGEISFGDEEEEDEEAVPAGVGGEAPGGEEELVLGGDADAPEEDEDEEEEEMVAAGLEDFDIGSEEDAGEDLEEEAEDEEKGEPLPTFGFGDEEEEEEEAEAEAIHEPEGAEARESVEEAAEEAASAEDDLPMLGFEDDESGMELESEEEEEGTTEPEAGADVEEAEEKELDASAFGVREEGDRAGKEYVEPADEDLPEVEAELEDVAPGEPEAGGPEAEPGPGDDVGDEVEEAVEEAASAERRAPGVDEEAEEEAEEETEAPADDDWLSAVDADAEEEAVAEEAVEPTAVEEEEAADLDPERLRTRSRELRKEDRAAEADDLLEEAHETLAEEGRMEDAVDVLSELIRAHPDEVDLRQRHVEYAYRLFDDDALVSAYHGLAETLRGHDEDRKAKAVYQQILDTDPDDEEATRALAELEGETRPEERREVTSSEEYVDLGSMILDEEEEEKSTRFVVAAEAPSGDEEADFARMLDQFKDKVAENVSTDDVAAHYDLGTAYKEMGLVDEAVGEFQAALRADREHLPTYEMLGQCFLEQDQPDSAARTLKKALDAPYEVEDELLGIYYFLGRAHEAMGDEESAVSYYDKVFDLDINFMDVTERLRNLR